MLRLLRKYAVSIVVTCLLIIGFILWNASRGYDDQAMANIPTYEGVDLSSTLAGADIRSRLEPSYLKYYNNWLEQGAADTEGVSIIIDGTDYAAVSDTGTRLERDLGVNQVRSSRLSMRTAGSNTRSPCRLTASIRWA